MLVDEVVQCILCKGALPPRDTDVITNHMKDQHRIFFNFDFIFSTLFLGSSKIEKTKHFMNSLKYGDQDFDWDWKEKDEPLNMSYKDEKNNLLAPQELETKEKDSAQKENDSFWEAQEKMEMKQISVCDREDTIKKEHIVSSTLSNHEMQKHGKENVTKQKEDLTTVKTLETSIKQKVPDGEDKEVPKKKKFASNTVCRCDIKFKSLKRKTYHIWAEHKKLPHCKPCKMAFKTQEKLLDHLNKRQHTISKSTICTICGKSFKCLSIHQRTCNVDVTLYRCDLCPNSIQYKGSLNLLNHKKYFHFDAPKECQYCGIFVRKLRDHIKIKHTENEAKKHECNECGKRFVTPYRLKDHQTTHSSVKPFLCQMGCGYASTSNGNRKKHENQVHLKVANKISN